MKGRYRWKEGRTIKWRYGSLGRRSEKERWGRGAWWGGLRRWGEQGTVGIQRVSEGIGGTSVAMRGID